MRASLLGLLLLACAPEDVVVAFVPDGGLHDPRGAPCTASSECPPDAFCEKASCDAVAGRCARRPVLCDATEELVCGCTGVTYFNDCLRRQAGVSVEARGECVSGVTCDGQACPSGSSCARLSASSCSAAAGRCWVVPSRCPASPGFLSCSNHTTCLDFCEAVRSEQPAVAAGHVCQ